MYASLARSRSRLQVPLVATFHSTRLLGMKEHLKMLAYRWFFWMADCAVFVCEAQRLYWRRRGVFSRRNEVIYNGVDTDLFSDKWTAAERAALRSALGFAGTDYVIGISAVLRPEKNHVQLVDAIAGLRNMGLPARALMIGDGATRGTVEARARELNVVGDIQITGFQQEVRPYIAASDVMALCSLTEAFSLAALEAMALRRAVVHSDVGGAAEMIFPSRNGFLFPAGDTSAFIGKLAILADRAISRHMGRNARELVEARFSEATMIDRYEQVLLEICRPAPGGGKRSAGIKAAHESARVGLHMDERKRR
jgi:glycosyltransferase involved in cell wall biosynthesis